MFEWIEALPFIGPSLSFLLPAIIAFGVVVAIHEYGHYIVGRWCGIHAEIFSLGFGPTVFQTRDKHGTIWRVAIIPLGGYVKFLGDMNAASMGVAQGEANPRMFQHAPLYAKFLTVLAGPVANFILSFTIFTAIAVAFGSLPDRAIIDQPIDMGIASHDLRAGDEIIAIDGDSVTSFSDIIAWTQDAIARDTHNYGVLRDGLRRQAKGAFPLPPVVANVLPVSAASQAGLRSNDVIRAVNGRAVSSFADVADAVKTSETEQITLLLWRDGAEQTVQITPRLQVTEEGGQVIRKKLLGVQGGLAFAPMREDISLAQAALAGVKRTWGVITGSVKSLRLLFTGTVGLADLQGPIGIAHSASDIAKSGWLDLVSFIAVLSTAIGFFNLLPIPVLDGGHLLHFAYQMVFRREVNAKGMAVITNVGLVLLLSLVVFVSFYDGIRLFG